MRAHTPIRLMAAFVSAVLVAGGTTAGALPRAEAESEDIGDAYVTVGERTLTVDEFIDEARGAAPEAPAVGGFLIDFPQWVQCFTINDADMVIKEYSTWWNGQEEKKRLKCGNGGDSGFGYKHIREAHEGDWQAKLDKITPTGLFPNVAWDDLMNAATVNALLVPDYTENVSGSKRCYVVKMGFYNQNRVLIDAYNVRVIAATNNDRVITALPLKDGKSFCNY